MATHSSVLAWAAVCGVAQSRTRLKRLSGGGGGSMGRQGGDKNLLFTLFCECSEECICVFYD